MSVLTLALAYLNDLFYCLPSFCPCTGYVGCLSKSSWMFGDVVPFDWQAKLMLQKTRQRRALIFRDRLLVSAVLGDGDRLLPFEIITLNDLPMATWSFGDLGPTVGELLLRCSRMRIRGTWRRFCKSLMISSVAESSDLEAHHMGGKNY